jgi:hypothetical protein
VKIHGVQNSFLNLFLIASSFLSLAPASSENMSLSLETLSTTAFTCFLGLGLTSFSESTLTFPPPRSLKRSFSSLSVFGSAVLVWAGAYGFFYFLSSILLFSPSMILLLIFWLTLTFVACTCILPFLIIPFMSNSPL